MQEAIEIKVLEEGDMSTERAESKQSASSLPKRIGSKNRLRTKGTGRGGAH